MKSIYPSRRCFAHGPSASSNGWESHRKHCQGMRPAPEEGPSASSQRVGGWENHRKQCRACGQRWRRGRAPAHRGWENHVYRRKAGGKGERSFERFRRRWSGLGQVLGEEGGDSVPGMGGGFGVGGDAGDVEEGTEG
ncbi:hypothetical protein Aph01nite_03410 [Acrocarpospora phusangensis]|uniref:Uncharacterized protein n=1 Tax=Acrocarpospora phusangensis TaxID=1070424 RepID=A0A919Q4L1_9ACTN|nr:hypothetical protein Aph01nite_03410 [Acrocarpospora phusangensis]